MRKENRLSYSLDRREINMVAGQPEGGGAGGRHDCVDNTQQ